MTVSAIDPHAYAKLLGQTLPSVIRTEEENEHFLAVLDKLTRHDNPSPEERQLADLLALLIEDFEAQHYALKPASPVAALTFFMEQQELKAEDLIDVFGAESVIGEILSGRRELSIEQIRKLAKRFHVSPELFLG